MRQLKLLVGRLDRTSDPDNTAGHRKMERRPPVVWIITRPFPRVLKAVLIQTTGMRLNAVDRASAAVAVGMTTVTLL